MQADRVFYNVQLPSSGQLFRRSDRKEFSNLWLPDKMSEIVNNGIIKQDMPAIWHNGLAMILVTAAGGLCSIIIR